MTYKIREIISNTTPIINLLTFSKLEGLKENYGKIIVPQGVFEEVEEVKNKDFYTDLSLFDWIEIKLRTDSLPLKYISDLDKGEAEVNALANETKADLVIIDEKLGREYANYFNLKLTGTIGVLLKVK